MKLLNVRVYVDSYTNGTIPVPDGMTLEEAFNYAKDHMDEIQMNLHELEPVIDSEELDPEEMDNPNAVYFSDLPGIPPYPHSNNS